MAGVEPLAPPVFVPAEGDVAAQFQVGHALRVPPPDLFYNPANAGFTVQRRINEVDVLKTAAPLMRPGAITNLLSQAGRKIKLLAPVFMDIFAPVEYRDNANYITAVASLCVPYTIGGRGEMALNICIQACAVGYSGTDCGTIAEAKAAVINGIKTRYAMMPQIVRDACTPNPAWLGNDNPIPDNILEFIIEAIGSEESQSAISLGIFTTALLSYCKQGNVTQNVITKVQNALRTDMNKIVTLDQNTMLSYWNAVGHWYTPEEAVFFFQVWETAIGEASLRLRLLVNQAGWSGLTNFQNIRKARVRFPDFSWAKAFALFTEDFNRYAIAEDRVKDDQYYGYRRDLGPVKSTNYPNLAYLAFSLLSQVGGDRTLRDFQGTNRNTPHAATIDRMIREYETERTNRADRLAPTHEQIAAVQGFLSRQGALAD